MTETKIESSDSIYGRAELSDTTPEAPFLGTSTFMRRPYRRDLWDVDIAVLGVPFDLAVCGRPGTRFGPRAIRYASRDISSWDKQYPWGFNPFKRLSVADYGDVIYRYGDAAAMVAQTQACVADILQQGAQPLCLGGDHYVSLPILREIAGRHGAISLVHFDAHTDTERNDNPYDHGCMFYRAVEEGLVDPLRSVQIGIRTDYDKEKDRFTVLDAPWVHRQGIDATIAQIKNTLADSKAYLTFDIDALDPAYAPATGTPVPGGLTSNQALEILRGLDGIDFVGMDVVEVAPDYDHAEITALIAAQLALEYICLQAAAD
ncbi:MAG: agmatinase [Gammaproteobacteria bacterium]|nr:agmatinase [Gammaproteobacteria bacterium]